LRLVLGADALGVFRNKLKSVEANLAEWEDVSLSTGFADN
jgi:hypothetical protein